MYPRQNLDFDAPQAKLRIEELLEERVTNNATNNMEVDITAEEEEELVVTPDLVDVEEIDVEIEKYKKDRKEVIGADGKIYVKCDNCGKSLTKQSLAKHKRLVRCSPPKDAASKENEKDEKERESLPSGSSKCNLCGSVNGDMRRHMRRVHGEIKRNSLEVTVDEEEVKKVKRDFTGEAEVNKVKKDFTGEAEVKKVEDFVSSTDADMINMKNKLEKMDDNDSGEVEIEENVNKCSRCPKTFAHKKNVARHERIHDRE